ncbi:MAG: hypothetical protein KTR32_40840 [Granulosicoccus sp.]|nr:hypothetical protein [Granulosicoccus sp.]
MKQTLKGVLCSALVFPGVGHLVLKAPKRGLLYVLLSLGCLIYVFSVLVPLVTDIVNEVVAGQASANPVDLNTLVHERMMNSGNTNLGAAIWGMIALWFIALIDVFVLGRKRDRDLSNSEQ